jgi:cytochrome c-type biogenesis protein CcmH
MMMLWFLLTLMTAAALALVAWPFVRGGRLHRGGSDVIVYNDQLAEIDRDREAGLMGQADAEASRIEISRRLLRAADRAENPAPATVKTFAMQRLAPLVAIVVALPVLAVGTYLRLGSPNYFSTAAIANRAADSDDASVEAMVVQVEKHLKNKPGDGRAWEVLAPVYMRLGRYQESVRAWQNAIANLGDNADREENLGESLVAAANGVVTDDAKAAFDQALAIDKNSVTARYYMGLAAKQDGRREEAAKIWKELIASAEPGADWVESVRNAVARLDEPSPASTEQASTGSGSQDAMIKSMVERLAERLKADGSDPDGWLRLVRSYNVLGDHDKAEATAVDARRALASDSEKLAKFEAGLKDASGPTTSTATNDTSQPRTASAPPPEHDEATVQDMVSRLAERLRTRGGDVENWVMLVKSYRTLGDQNKANAASAQARAAFSADPERLARLNALLGTANSSEPATAATDTSSPPQARPEAKDAGNQQATMIQGMVNRLAERLKQNGGDTDGWIQLMRSYMVLGQPDRAVAAGLDARKALADNSEALRQLNDGAKQLGVELP